MCSDTGLLHFAFRFVHRVVTVVTTSGMPSPGMGSGKRGGATATQPQESRLARGCPSSPVRASPSRSRSRSASLCPRRAAAKCQRSLASLCQRRVADRCQCRNQRRLPRRFALEVEVLTDPEATEDTGAEKLSVALVALKISLLNTAVNQNFSSKVCSNSCLLTSLLAIGHLNLVNTAKWGIDRV